MGDIVLELECDPTVIIERRSKGDGVDQPFPSTSRRGIKRQWSHDVLANGVMFLRISGLSFVFFFPSFLQTGEWRKYTESP